MQQIDGNQCKVGFPLPYLNSFNILAALLSVASVSVMLAFGAMSNFTSNRSRFFQMCPLPQVSS
jgi:hypothetical protein